MMKFYKDWYGCTASTEDTFDGVRLVVRLGNGKKTLDKTYNTERGAKIAMGKQTDSGWELQK